jgi:hypothetical protein
MPEGVEPTGMGEGGEILRVKAQLPLSPDPSESVPDTEYTPTGAVVGESTAPDPLTLTPAEAAVVTYVTGPMSPVTASCPAYAVPAATVPVKDTTWVIDPPASAGVADVGPTTPVDRLVAANVATTTRRGLRPSALQALRWARRAADGVRRAPGMIALAESDSGADNRGSRTSGVLHRQ